MQSAESPARAVKKSNSVAFCLATCVLAAAALLSAQEPTAPSGKQEPTAPSSAKQEPAAPSSGKNVTSEQVNDANVQLMRQDIRAERKKIIAANMPLTETEATKFWPLYDRYIGETIKVNDLRYALIKEYAQSYSAMTDAQADSFIKRWVALDRDNTQLRLKYIPEFENVISHKKTALFFQLDRRIAMLIELQLASQVPLVKP
jgi:hypothetical protein